MVLLFFATQTYPFRRYHRPWLSQAAFICTASLKLSELVVDPAERFILCYD